MSELTKADLQNVTGGFGFGMKKARPAPAPAQAAPARPATPFSTAAPAGAPDWAKQMQEDAASYASTHQPTTSSNTNA